MTTEKASHTPGPWKVVRDFSPHKLCVRGMVGPNWPNGGRSIVWFTERRSGAHRGETVQWRGFDPQDEADANLIAAAPEMLKALEQVREAYSAYQLIANPTKPFAIAIVDDAIRKAKGEL